MQAHIDLSSSPKIKELFRQSKVDGFRCGASSVLSLPSQNINEIASNLEETTNRLREAANKIMEIDFNNYAERGLLSHQLSPSIENYWKNVGSYFFMAIDDVQKEIDDESNNNQMTLL